MHECFEWKSYFSHFQGNYEEDPNRYRTYPEPDDLKVHNAHNHLKNVDFNKPSVDESIKFNYELTKDSEEIEHKR